MDNLQIRVKINRKLFEFSSKRSSVSNMNIENITGEEDGEERKGIEWKGMIFKFCWSLILLPSGVSYYFFSECSLTADPTD